LLPLLLLLPQAAIKAAPAAPPPAMAIARLLLVRTLSHREA